MALASPGVMSLSKTLRDHVVVSPHAIALCILLQQYIENKRQQLALLLWAEIKVRVRAQAHDHWKLNKANSLGLRCVWCRAETIIERKPC
jgi:hypothetical protein